MNRAVTTVIGLLIAAVMVFHAAMVFIMNSPVNEIRRLASPLMDAYNGPWLSQGWTMFAPDPPHSNERALVRGRTKNGRITGWYDVTEYFDTALRANRFTVVRPEAEGFAHGLTVLSSGLSDRRAIGNEIVTRTAAQVLRIDANNLQFVQMQLDIERAHIRAIDYGPANPTVSRTITRWMAIPSPSAL